MYTKIGVPWADMMCPASTGIFFLQPFYEPPNILVQAKTCLQMLETLLSCHHCHYLKYTCVNELLFSVQQPTRESDMDGEQPR